MSQGRVSTLGCFRETPWEPDQSSSRSRRGQTLDLDTSTFNCSVPDYNNKKATWTEHPASNEVRTLQMSNVISQIHQYPRIPFKDHLKSESPKSKKSKFSTYSNVHCNWIMSLLQCKKITHNNGLALYLRVDMIYGVGVARVDLALRGCWHRPG